MALSFQKLLNQIESVTAKKTYEDDTNYWKLTKDKAGNASAVIRFLPNADQEDIPFVRLYTHSFKDPSTNRWYIENSLSTIGGQDYVGEVNSELWNTGLDENKEIVRARKRKTNFISNILVIKDTGNPENDGTVRLFKYGKKIFDKIIQAAKPDETLGEDPINVFDTLEGADFILRQTEVAGFPNYDQSKFGSKKPITGGQKRIDEVLAQCHDLNLEIAPSKFKTPEELKKKFLWVTGQETKTEPSSYDKELDELTKIANEPTPKSEAKVESKPRKTPPMPAADPGDDSSDEDFFKNLIDG